VQQVVERGHVGGDRRAGEPGHPAVLLLEEPDGAEVRYTCSTWSSPASSASGFVCQRSMRTPCGASAVAISLMSEVRSRTWSRSLSAITCRMVIMASSP
jgi:hypothetical protein